jgi:hypothetical protein
MKCVDESMAMTFVPEGQRDRSQVRRAWAGVWTFPRAWVWVGSGLRPNGPCPEGAIRLSPGFQPREPGPTATSPEGAPDRLAQKRPKECHPASVLALSIDKRTLFQFIGAKLKGMTAFFWRPFRARRRGWVVPGVETQAKSYSPFGARPWGRRNHAQQLAKQALLPVPGF